mgnify:CR=1 FL=1
MEYKKNDRVTVTIEDMGSDGEGIGKVDVFTLFIKDAVIGDQVEAKIIKSKKHYAYARLEKVLQPSPFRVEPKCAYHRQCAHARSQKNAAAASCRHSPTPSSCISRNRRSAII